MLILSKINNYIMSVLKSIWDWLSNLMLMFLYSLKDDRWMMFYLTILLVILLNLTQKDGTVYNKHRIDGDGEKDDGDEGEGGDKRAEDENTDDDDDDNDDDDVDDYDTDDYDTDDADDAADAADDDADGDADDTADADDNDDGTTKRCTRK